MRQNEQRTKRSIYLTNKSIYLSMYLTETKWKQRGINEVWNNFTIIYSSVENEIQCAVLNILESLMFI